MRKQCSTSAVLWLLGLVAYLPDTFAQPPNVESLANFRVWLIETVPAKPEQFDAVIGEHLALGYAETLPTAIST